MSFGLSRGKTMDTTGIGRTSRDFPPIPADVRPPDPSAWVDPRPWFPISQRPLEIEIGSGKGTFLVQQASVQADTNFLGIEYAGEFFRYAADRIRRRGLDNVRMLYADAVEYLSTRCPTAIARVLHLYFSDPWPKARHHKRRVLQDGFLEQAHRVLLPGGELRIVTDHADYWAWMEEYFDRWCIPERGERGEAWFDREPFQSPPSAGEGEVVGTNFERKYRPEGRVFNAVVLRKPEGSSGCA